MREPSRQYPPRPLLAASLAVFREGKVLLASRVEPPLKGVFSLPGGLVEPGETMEEAALRELREEVGVTARVIGFNRHVEVIDKDESGRVRHHFVIASFVGMWLYGEGTPGPEAGEIVWRAPDDLAGLPTTSQLPHILAAAQRIYKAGG